MTTFADYMLTPGDAPVPPHMMHAGPCPEGCRNCGAPYCHCTGCGETDVDVDDDGRCAACIERDRRHTEDV